MNSILQLFIRNGGLLTFVLVEAFCFYLIVRNNDPQREIYLHSFAKYSSALLNYERQWIDYFSLEKQVDSLQRENARLWSLWENARLVQIPKLDTFYSVLYDSIASVDSVKRKLIRPSFEFIPAQVVGNSISNTNNWVIINRGKRDLVEKGAGVLAPNGLVGIVKQADDEFSLVMSMLHQETKISASLKRQGALGSLVWEGGDPSTMTLKYIPKHFNVKDRDSVITSGYSQIFPRDYFIGLVEGQPMQDPENPYYLLVKVRLSCDMSNVNHVYVVRNLFRTELDSLKLQIKQ